MDPWGVLFLGGRALITDLLAENGGGGTSVGVSSCHAIIILSLRIGRVLIQPDVSGGCGDRGYFNAALDRYTFLARVRRGRYELL